MTTTIFSHDPRTGSTFGDALTPTTPEELAAILDRAEEAAPTWRATSDSDRARALRAVADALDAASEELVDIADRETALGRVRLSGEVARTTGQLRMFADIVEEGSYVEAVISHAHGSARPDIRRMLTPVGPVGVFSASNFPFAFSVAGGDTASALAVGCPVVVKVHDGHPATSYTVARIAKAALTAAGAPEGVLDVVIGRDAGVRLVQHPTVKAASFTGSTAGGRALFDLANARPDPIPFYGELGSVNPVVVLPGAAASRPEDVAQGYAESLTLGIGQYCTNPNLLLIPASSDLAERIGEAVSTTVGGPMLTDKVHDAYEHALEDWSGLALLASAPGDGPWAGAPQVRTLRAADATAEVVDVERFGPAGLVVTYDSVAEAIGVLELLDGSLTGSIQSDDRDLEDARRVTEALLPRVGRLVMNGWPTGVAVCWAMHHGGPWPATTAAGHTSVGGTAIRRWLAPVAYQNYSDDLLPVQLQESNPRGIRRAVQPD